MYVRNLSKDHRNSYKATHQYNYNCYFFVLVINKLGVMLENKGYLHCKSPASTQQPAKNSIFTHALLQFFQKLQNKSNTRKTQTTL